VAVFFSNCAIASEYLGFKLCDSFDAKSEEIRLSKDKIKIKLEKSNNQKYPTYWVEYFDVFEGGVFNLRLTVVDGGLYRISLFEIDTAYHHNYDEYFKRMKKKYGNPKFFAKTQNEYMIDVWDLVYKYQINDKEVDVIVNTSSLKSTTNAYGFNFSGSYGVNTNAEYVCKSLDKTYTEYIKNNEIKNKKPNVKF
jgi:hypothetical protein